MKKFITLILAFICLTIDAQTGGGGTSGSTNGWLLNGNGNTGTTSYLGTSNNRSLVIKTAATERIKVDSVGRTRISGSLTVNGPATFTGSITTPTLYGSSSPSGTLNIFSTSSATAGVINIGTSGGSSILNSGNVNITNTLSVGSSTAVGTSSLVQMYVTKPSDTGTLSVGTSGGNAFFWAVPTNSISNTNYSQRFDATNTLINSPSAAGSVFLRNANTTIMNINSGGAALTGTMSVSGTSTLTGNVTTSSITSTGAMDLGAATGSVVSLKSGTSNIAQFSSSSGFLPNKTRIGSFTTPSATLDVTGTMSVSSTATVAGNFYAPSIASSAGLDVGCGGGSSITFYRGASAMAGILNYGYFNQNLRVGSSSSPSATLDVTGTGSVSSTFTVNGTLTTNSGASIGGNTTISGNLAASTMSISGTSTLTGAVQTSTINNNSGTLYLGAFGNNNFNLTGGSVGFTPSGASTMGSTSPFTFQTPSHFSITASTNVPAFKVLGNTRGFMSGAKALQYENYFSAGTYTATGATTITTASGLHVEKPIMSTNVTATNVWGITTDGGISATGNLAATGSLYLGSGPSVLSAGNTGTIAVLSDAVFPVQFNNSAVSPADGATYYIGNLPYGSISSATIGRHYLPYNCTLVGWSMSNISDGVAGSAESVSVSVRVNNTTDVSLSTSITFSASTSYTASGLSTNFSAGDLISIKVVCPTWVTNPTLFYSNLTLWFVRRQ